MSRFLWFMGGFVLTLGLLAVGAFWALQRLGAEPGEARLLPADATPTLPDPAWSLTATPTLQPAEHTDMLLAWRSQGTTAAACARLEIDSAQQALYGPCDEGQRLAPLTQTELDMLLLYAMRFKPFTYTVREETGTVAEQTITLSFNGTGRQTAGPQNQAEIAAWAAAVQQRLTAAEARADLIAACRSSLSIALGLNIEQIQPLTLTEVRWPDACLGLHESGVYCAQVVTPGYQLTFMAAERVYECRADRYGHIRPAEGFTAPFLLPPLGD